MTKRQDEKFVWNDEYPQVIDVRTVEQLGGFDVRMRFSNGEVRELSLERYLQGPIFEPLRNDPELYGRMNIEGGAIAWPNGADIAPETLYEDSHPIQVKRPVKRASNSAKRTVGAARRRPVRPAR